MSKNRIEEDKGECTEEVSEEVASDHYNDASSAFENETEQKKFSETLRDGFIGNDKGMNSSTGMIKSPIEHFSKPLSQI